METKKKGLRRTKKKEKEREGSEETNKSSYL